MLYSRWVQVIFIRLLISTSIHTDTFAVHPRLTTEERSQQSDNPIAVRGRPFTNEGRW